MADYLTYDNIGDQIENLIDDSDTDTRTVIDQVINNVYRDLVADISKSCKTIPSWLKDYDDSLSTAASTRTTTLATASKNVEKILMVSVDDYPCSPITEEELEIGATYWWDTSNTTRPTRYYHEKAYGATGTETNKLYWFALPDAIYSIRYWFEKRVSPLSGASDVPILPPWSHNALIYGSLIQMPLFDVRVKAGPWAVLYDQIVTNLKGYSNNFVIQGQTKPFAL